MPLAIRNGLTFHVQQIGDQGPPVIMLHGLLVANLATFYFSTAPALARTHRVLVYDLRGHGRSERVTQGYDIETMSGDLAAIAEEFTREPYTLVGHSYGAAIAIHHAIAHPDRVARLVAIEAPLPPSRLEELDSFLEKSPAAMVETLPDSLKNMLGGGGRRASKLVESLAFLATRTTLLEDLRRAPDIDDAALASIRCKTTLVYGRRSSCWPVGQRLARVIPGAKLVEIEGGHFLPVENPTAVTHAVMDAMDG